MICRPLRGVPLHDRPLRSPLLYAGLAIWAVCFAAWGAVWAFSRDLAVGIAATFGAFFVGGKIAAIPMGASFDLPGWVIMLTVLLPDVGAVLVTYPLTHGGLEFLGRWSKWVRRMHEEAVEAAEKREGFLHRFGGVGLFLMALSPVGFYSPILVAAIGQLMGLGARRVLLPVLGAMILMTVLLVTALDAALGAMAKVDGRLPFVVSIGLLATFIGLDQWRRHRRRKRAKENA